MPKNNARSGKSVSSLLLAFCAILLWSFLGYLGSSLSHLPALLTTALALLFSGTLSLVRVRNWRVPFKTLLIGVGGIFGYHLLYFLSLQHAPAIEANLINYLWPLLIVLLSPLYLPDHHLKSWHLLGALSGLTGAFLIISGGKLGLQTSYLNGYTLAAAAAFIWASYSLLSKRVSPFPTAAVGLFCFVSGLLALGLYTLQHGSLEILNTLSPNNWLNILLLGAGPLGGAFFLWDASLKRGDPRVIGALAYLTPLLSTLLLVLWGGKELNWVSVTAMLLIIGGAVIGSWDLLRGK